MSWGRVLLWVVLGASLMANAVVLGIFLRAGGFGEAATGLRAAWATVPAEARAHFRSEVVENRQTLRTLLADLRSARTEMFTAAAARPYDRAAVVAAQHKVRAASAALQAKAQEMMLDAFDRAAAEGSP